MLNRLITLALAGVLSFGLVTAAPAAQGTGCMPTTGTVSGLTFAQDVNAAIAALISSNSGASAPATDCTATAIKGQVWLDTSVTPNVLKMYDGASTWVPIGSLDAASHLWAPPIGGGTATLSSGTTVDLWSSGSSSITVSGTTTVTAFANASAVPGTVKLVTASGVFTMTHNATSLILPGASDITTAVGDSFLVYALTSTNVRVLAYTRADGSAVVNPSVALGTVMYGDYGTIPAKTVYGFGQALSRASYPAYLAAVTRAQTATLTSGNSTITSVGNTAGLGAGMPLEGTGIQAGTVISSVTSSTIVMSKTATANGSQTVTAFITGYGSGGDSTTVGVRDCRGRVMAGRDDMGGTAASRLTSTYFGTAATKIGANGGGESQTLTLSQAPTGITSANAAQSITVDVGGGESVPSGFWTGLAPGVSTGTLYYPYNTSPSALGFATSFTGSNSISVTSSNTGGNPHPIVPPTGVAECVVVVLP